MSGRQASLNEAQWDPKQSSIAEFDEPVTPREECWCANVDLACFTHYLAEKEQTDEQ